MASDEPQTTPPEETPSAPAEDSTFASVQRRLEGKPVLIYGTLIGGALVLLLLLMIVWLSTRDNGSSVVLCLDTTVAEVEASILDGGVRRVDVLLDAERPVEGLTAIQLELENGECRKLPEGADNRASLLQVLGLIELYNQEGDGNVRVEYQRETIPPNLLLTSTPVPTETPPTTEASPTAASPVPALTTTPTPTSSPSPTAAPSNVASPSVIERPTITPASRPTTAPASTP